jgi:hypothetical protein
VKWSNWVSNEANWGDESATKKMASESRGMFLKSLSCIKTIAELILVRIVRISDYVKDCLSVIFCWMRSLRVKW